MKYIREKDIILRKRKKSSHKGDFGRVLVIGGSREFTGAPALAGLAGLRSGADISLIASPEKSAWAINSLSPDLITHKLKGDYIGIRHIPELIRLSKKADSVLIGCGIGSKSNKAVKKIIKKISRLSIPLIIDADAINAAGIQDADKAIFTPHLKELENLLDNSGYGRINKLEDIDKKAVEIQKIIGNNIILLKGSVDRIISAQKIAYNNTGNPGMTVGGTGDILAGLTAGFIAQGYNRFDSACWAAFINGRAGDILYRKRKGYSFIASDIVNDIKLITEKLRRK